MRLADNTGQATVETALVLPLVLGLVTGIFVLGQVFGTQLVLTNAAREGARVGALGRPDGRVRETILAYLAGAGLETAATRVSVLHPRNPDGPDVQIRLDHPLQVAVQIPGLPDPLWLAASATMRQEAP
jgi:hypothetical protein